MDGSGCFQLNIVEVLFAMPEEINSRSVYSASLLVVLHCIGANQLEVLREGKEGPVLFSMKPLAHSLEAHGVLDDTEVVWCYLFCDRYPEEAIRILLFKVAHNCFERMIVCLLSRCWLSRVGSAGQALLTIWLAVQHAIGLGGS